LHLLYCDESNIDKRKGDFLIYGGLMVDAEQCGNLTRAIDELRSRLLIPRDYDLKFNPGPKGFPHNVFISLKQQVLELSTAHGARLIVYVILHDIAKSPDEARRNGINTVCFHFHCILNRVGGPGLVLIDRFNDKGNVIDDHLREKFAVGLTGLPYSKEMRLPNILGFHYSTIGQSHFPSIIDVALGSLRFVLNAHTRRETKSETKSDATVRSLLSLLSPMFWREKGRFPISELGFMFSPKMIKMAHFRGQYKSLQQFLADGGIKTEQRVGA
jgi:hypothetical protein